MKLLNDIYDYIQKRENLYRQGIFVVDTEKIKWQWGMKEHIAEGIIYKHSQLAGNKMKGTIDELPVKNIIKPLLNVQYRAEDIEVKNILLYVEDENAEHLSFIIKKYHDNVFIVENDLDTFFDDFKEEKIDLGLAIAMDVGKAKPEILHLQDIAFCNQYDVLADPIGFVYEYTPSDLEQMADKYWGDKNYGADITIEELIKLAKTQKNSEGNDLKDDTIKVYLVLGSLPEKYFAEDGSFDEYSYQMQVVGFYHNENGKQGVTLFKTKIDNPLKILKRDPIYNRACGWGAVEELVEPQIWTNYGEIRKKEMMDGAAKVVYLNDDPKVQAKHPKGLKGIGTFELINVTEGKKGIWQADTYPRNFSLFDKTVNDFWQHAQTLASAHDPMLGMEAPSGTPFRAQERQVIEGTSIHEYRKGKYAKFIEEMYQDWFLPYIVKQIIKDQEFLADLSADEMQFVADRMTVNKVNRIIVQKILNGEWIDKEEIENLKIKTRENFVKSGNKKLIKIFAGELKEAVKKLKIKINVENKQKNFGSMMDSISNIIRFILSTYNPQTGQSALDKPEINKLFNQMIEYAGLEPLAIARGQNAQQSVAPIQANVPQLAGQQ